MNNHTLQIHHTINGATNDDAPSKPMTDGDGGKRVWDQCCTYPVHKSMRCIIMSEDR